MNISATARIKPIQATSAYYAAFIMLGATTAIGGPALPWLAQHTASRLDQVSAIFIAGSLGYMLGSLLGGRAYDRFPGHRLEALALLASVAAAACVPLLHSLLALVAVLFFLGSMQGVLDVGCNTLLAWIHGPRVGPFMNGLHFFFGVGSFLAPLLFAQVVLATSEIRWAYWLFCIISLPVVAWLWVTPSPEIRHESAGAHSSAGHTWLVALFVLIFLAYVGMEVGFGNWIYTYSLRLNLANEAIAAYLTSAFWGSFTLGRLLGIGISTRLHPLGILSMDLLGCLAGFSVILLWPASSTVLWAGTMILGLCMASVFPTVMAIAEKRLRLVGSITGWFLVGGGIGGMLLPWIIGQLFVRSGPRITMPVLLIDLLVNLALLLVLILSSKKQAA